MRGGETQFSASDQTVSGRAKYERLRSAYHRYKPSDIEQVRTARTVGRTRRRIREVLVIVTVAVGLTGAAALGAAALDLLDLIRLFRPSVLAGGDIACTSVICGPEARLSWGDLISSLAGLLIGLAAGGYAFRRIRWSRKEARRVAQLASIEQSLRSRRMINPGAGQLSFSLGDEGLQIRGLERTLSFDWSGFDLSELVELNPELAAVLRGAKPPPCQLDDLQAEAVTDEALAAFLNRAETFAEDATRLLLPLHVSQECLNAAAALEQQRLRALEPVKKKREQIKVTASDIKWREFIVVPAHFFTDGDDDRDWRLWVRACLYMLARQARSETG